MWNRFVAGSDIDLRGPIRYWMVLLAMVMQKSGAFSQIIQFTLQITLEWRFSTLIGSAGHSARNLAVASQTGLNSPWERGGKGHYMWLLDGWREIACMWKKKKVGRQFCTPSAKIDMTVFEISIINASNHEKRIKPTVERFPHLVRFENVLFVRWSSLKFLHLMFSLS